MCKVFTGILSFLVYPILVNPGMMHSISLHTEDDLTLKMPPKKTAPENVCLSLTSAAHI